MDFLGADSPARSLRRPGEAELCLHRLGAQKLVSNELKSSFKSCN